MECICEIEKSSTPGIPTMLNPDASCPVHGEKAQYGLKLEHMNPSDFPNYKKFIETHVAVALRKFVPNAINVSRRLFIEKGIEEGMAEIHTRNVSSLTPEQMSIIITGFLVLIANSDFDTKVLTDDDEPISTDDSYASGSQGILE